MLINGPTNLSKTRMPEYPAPFPKSPGVEVRQRLCGLQQKLHLHRIERKNDAATLSTVKHASV